MNTQYPPKQVFKKLGLGVGLRHQHFNHILKHKPQVDWFEIISENFMDDFGWAKHVLLQIANDYPIVMHGVSMSIGSTDAIDYDYLHKLSRLAKEVKAQWISDHLCWTGVNGINSHDLLPLPLSEESLKHVCEKVSIIQHELQQAIVLENPSTYLNFKDSTISEWQFLNELSATTGCRLLLDVNNVYVSSRNHGFDPYEYIDKINHQHIVQVHIAGHTDNGDHCIDTHDQAVCNEVWALYAHLKQKTQQFSTLLEWDAKIPSFPELLQELHKANNVEQQLKDNVLKPVLLDDRPQISNPIDFMLGTSHE
ncbi:MAG TPA: DUF692 domain-containing protein [Oceanospirillales bacterium]|nr:DUF692 domain-containing protein [Oceanospirillales bacterium]